MDSARLEALVAWIGENPTLAGLVIFLIAFGDALVIVGVAIPAVPLLFAVGTLVGLGHVDGAYALACATLGAFAGDAISFWVGRRWGPQLRNHWPFRKYPQLLERGEIMFRRNAIKSIFVARYVGPVRPFVPAIAGMAHMPLRRYVPMSLLACFLWAGIFLAPGWIFGASYDAVAAVAVSQMGQRAQMSQRAQLMQMIQQKIQMRQLMQMAPRIAVAVVAVRQVKV